MTNYRTLNQQLNALLTGERDRITNCAQTCALLYHEITEVNWVGFYFPQGDELLLGPFQGKVACTRIAMGKGVCGTAAMTQKNLVVNDVRQFNGHIACDKASASEIVLPLMKNKKLLAVLDIDSPKKQRFANDDLLGLSTIVDTIISCTDFNQ